MKWIDVPPAWLLLFLLLGWAQVKAVPLVQFPGWVHGLGDALILLALALMAAAAWQFLRHRTTIVPRARPSALIDSGVFGLSRNPIYLADAMVLAGFSLSLDAVLTLVLTPAFMQLIAQRYIRREEVRMTEAFGDEFCVYAARVRRWL